MGIHIDTMLSHLDVPSPARVELQARTSLSMGGQRSLGERFLGQLKNSNVSVAFAGVWRVICFSSSYNAAFLSTISVLCDQSWRRVFQAK